MTPAHDPDDYECARRHGLPVHNIFDLKGMSAMCSANVMLKTPICRPVHATYCETNRSFCISSRYGCTILFMDLVSHVAGVPSLVPSSCYTACLPKTLWHVCSGTKIWYWPCRQYQSRAGQQGRVQLVCLSMPLFFGKRHRFVLVGPAFAKLPLFAWVGKGCLMGSNVSQTLHSSASMVMFGASLLLYVHRL